MVLILFLTLLPMVTLLRNSAPGGEGPSLHQWGTLLSPCDGWKWQRLYVDTHSSFLDLTRAGWVQVRQIWAHVK